MFSFLLWPLFARAPRHWFLDFFCCRPRVCKVFFFVLRSVGRRDLSAGPEQKKNTTQGVFFAPAPGKRQGKEKPRAGTGPEQQKKTPPRVSFFCCGPSERQGKEKPRWAPARGQSKKKHHPGCFFFFCSGPGERQGKEKPCWAPARGQSKKKHHPGVLFFALAPCRRPTELLLPLPFPGAGAKKHPGWCFFFCSGPVPAPNGASPSLASRRGRSKKTNTLGGVFFLLWPRAGTGLLLPCLSPGPEQIKKHPGWCFFFCCGPAQMRTHSLRAWVAMPPPRRGGVFFFLLRPRPDRGGVFFCCGPARHSLTVGWGDFGKARVVFFFASAPPGLFRQ